MKIEQKRITSKVTAKRSIIILEEVDYLIDGADIARWASRNITSLVSKKLKPKRLALGFRDPLEARKFVRWVESPKRER